MRPFFGIRQPREVIQIERSATFRSYLSKFHLVPTVHSVDDVTFLSDAHRFVRDYAMDDFFVFRLWPASHSTATPINGMPNIIISIGPLFEIKKRACVSGENRRDVLQCARITDLSNSLAKRPQRFCRDCSQA